MPIRAIFTSGQTESTVNGLHQWDYGQKLEIYCDSLPTVVEVHFACVGMSEAVVRTCSVSSGCATVTIPDRCLEQTTPITAWVFEIDDNEKSGTTTKKIILPIEARTMPSAVGDIPTENSNKYTELITAVNGAVTGLGNGTIKAQKAENADTANTAQIAYYASADTTKGTIEERLNIQASKDQIEYAATAGYATTAGSATTADYATDADSARIASYANAADVASHATTAERANSADTAGYATSAGTAAEVSSIKASILASTKNVSTWSKKLTLNKAYAVSFADKTWSASGTPGTVNTVVLFLPSTSDMSATRVNSVKTKDGSYCAYIGNYDELRFYDKDDNQFTTLYAAIREL